MILGFTLPSFAAFVGVSLVICVTVCALAMEASVLFVPAFVVFFPFLFRGFPSVTPNEAIGLAITVEFFGYTSSVTGYWVRRQIDFHVAGKLLLVTVPLAAVGRVLAYFVPEDGLLVLFAVLLFVLAVVIQRAHRDTPRTCLLCGDSLVGMEPGEGEAVPVDAGDGGRADGPGDYRPRTRLFGQAPDPGHSLAMGKLDRVIAGSGGVLAGLVGIAIGEISNTFLTLRKGIPLKISTGTSALVLHLTILAALGTNLLVLASGVELFGADELVVPWKIAGVLAPVVVVGGTDRVVSQQPAPGANHRTGAGRRLCRHRGRHAGHGGSDLRASGSHVYSHVRLDPGRRRASSPGSDGRRNPEPRHSGITCEGSIASRFVASASPIVPSSSSI